MSKEFQEYQQKYLKNLKEENFEQQNYKEKYFIALKEKQELQKKLEQYNENTVVESMNSMKEKYNYLKKHTIDISIFNEVFSRYKHLKEENKNILKIIEILNNKLFDKEIKSFNEIKVYIDIILQLNECSMSCDCDLNCNVNNSEDEFIDEDF